MEAGAEHDLGLRRVHTVERQAREHALVPVGPDMQHGEAMIFGPVRQILARRAGA